VVETPSPNLVEGMKWFLGVYTRSAQVSSATSSRVAIVSKTHDQQPALDVAMTFSLHFPGQRPRASEAEHSVTFAL
jgi:hypothetical protein